MKPLNAAAHDVLAHYENILDRWTEELHLTDREWVYLRCELRMLRNEMRELLMAALEEAHEHTEVQSETTRQEIRDVIENAMDNLGSLLIQIG